MISFVVKLDSNVLAKVGQRNLRTWSDTEVSGLVGPFFELCVVGDTPLEGNRLVPSPAGRSMNSTRVSAFPMLKDVCRAPEGTDLTDARYVAAIPLDPELEVLVRILAAGVHGELCYRGTSLHLTWQRKYEGSHFRAQKIVVLIGKFYLALAC